MAIAEDASTPAAKTQTTTAAITCASFTPPAGALIIAIVILGNSTGATACTGAISDSLSGTWTTDFSYSSAVGLLAVYRRTTTTANSAITVTFTPTTGHTNFKGTQLSVRVITGNASSPLGATASTTTGITTGAQAITPQAVGSLIYFLFCNIDGQYSLTVESNSTAILDTEDSTNGETYGTGKLTNTTANTSSVTVGYTNTGMGSDGIVAAVEYKSGATAIAASITPSASVTAANAESVALACAIT